MPRQRRRYLQGSSFKPIIENLEGRYLLSNAQYVAAIEGLFATAQTSLDQAIAADNAFANDQQALLKGGGIGALVNAAVDAFSLQNLAAIAQQQATLLDNAIQLGKAYGFLDQNWGPPGGETSLLFDVNHLQNRAITDLQFVQKDIQAYISGNLASLPAQGASQGVTNPPTTTPGPVSENIDKAPSTWPSDAKIGPSESVTVTNTSNEPKTVTVSFQGDGFSTSQTDVCTNNTITVSDGAPVLPAGHTGTFTVSVTGQPDQTNTVNYQ
jgi:hypothetical protein